MRFRGGVQVHYPRLEPAGYQIVRRRRYYVVSAFEDESGYAACKTVLEIRCGRAPRCCNCWCGQRSLFGLASRSCRLWTRTAPTAESAAELLLECIDAGKPIAPKRMLIQPTLVVRESSRVPVELCHAVRARRATGAR